MKKTLFLILWILAGFSTAVYGNAPLSRQEAIDAAVAAVNNRDASGLEPFLAGEFSISGQNAEVSMRILDMLVKQLDDRVLDNNFVSSEDADGLTAVTYTFDYEKIGKRNARFVFNSDGLLTEVSLIEMKVHVVQPGGTENIVKGEEPVLVIPFRLMENLIIVEAQINGIERSFFLDSGAPSVILNSAYINNSDRQSQTIGNARGVAGQISNMNVARVGEFSWGGAKMREPELITMDLSHLEKDPDIQIYGLIGYDFLKGYDILYDYENMTLTLIDYDKSPDYAEKNLRTENTVAVPFRQTNHLQIVDVGIGGKTYSMALDSGAGANLIGSGHLDELEEFFSEWQEDNLQGANANTSTVKTGKLTMNIAGRAFDNTRTVVSNIDHLNIGDGPDIHGIIGYEIMSRQKILFRNGAHEIWFIE